MRYAWTCPCCGKPQSHLPLDIGAAAPDAWLRASEAERRAGHLGADLCYLGTNAYLRVCLEIPIQGHAEVFTYGVWVSLSPVSLERVRELWTETVPDDEPSKFGWLCTEIRDFPGSAGLKSCVWLRNANKRPRLELEPTAHPLSIAQREGLEMSRVQEIVAAYMPKH